MSGEEFIFFEGKNSGHGEDQKAVTAISGQY